MINPIHKSISVPLSADEAFDLFTKKVATWWPGETHSVSAHGGSEPKDIHFGTHKGDDIVEITSEGKTSIWGKILAHDPGKFLAFTWFPGKSEDEATVVTLAFEQTDTGTKCTLCHGGFGILGEHADAVSSSYLTGWDMVLGCFSSAAKTPAFA